VTGARAAGIDIDPPGHEGIDNRRPGIEGNKLDVDAVFLKIALFLLNFSLQTKVNLFWKMSS
jgi:hypothetical protein